MSLIALALRQRRLLNVVALFFLVTGAVAAFRMPREVFPNVTMDIVIVRADYPGAAAAQIEQLIIAPIEKELRTVADIKETASVATEDFALTIVEIEPNAPDKRRTVREIQRAIDRITDLPADLPHRPTVRELQTRNNPIIEIALTGLSDEAELQQWAKALETRILDLDDVAGVNRRGWRDRQIWVEVDPVALRNYDLSLAAISAQLARHNVEIPGGLVTSGTTDLVLRTSGRLQTPDDVGAVVVRTTEEGRPIPLGSIANIHWDVAEATTLQRVGGAKAIVLVVTKRAGGDAIRLTDSIRHTTEDFAAVAPASLRVSYLNDFSFFLRRRLKVLAWNGTIGLGLVLACILAFLSFRTAAGAALGLPVAALGALAAMWWFGATINMITLFGMIMVVGMLVDEDLVIAENIHRYLELHADPTVAVARGTQEIMRSVVATVFTTIAAFLPLLFLAGIIGKFTRWIPLVVIITLSCSLLEALIILPSHLHDLCLLIRGGRLTATRDWRWFIALRAAYLRALKRVLPHRYIVAGSGTVLLAAALVAALKVIPFTLFPARGLEIFFVRADAPMGTPLSETERRYEILEQRVRNFFAEPSARGELDNFAAQIGISQNDPEDPATRRGSHVGQIAIYLTPPAKRDRSLEAIVGELRPRLTDTPGFTRITVDRVRPGPPVGKPIAIKIRGPDFAVLEQLAGRLKDALAGLSGVTDIMDDYEPGKIEVAIEPDATAAARAGVQVADIGRAVRAAFEGEIATRIRTVDEEHDVLVRLPIGLRSTAATLERVPVPNSMGRLIPLGHVARYQDRPGPITIKHLDGQRAITVLADVDEEITTATAVSRHIRPIVGVIEGEHPRYTVTFGGEVESTRESLASLKIALLLAALLILGILVTTLDSYGDAGVVLTTIPLGLVGVVAGFWLMGHAFSFMALMGMVGLAGIVVDSAIILIDFIRRRQREGVILHDAIMESAQIRFRPIVLVTLTTVLGIVASAFGIGGTDPFIQPMALAMNWGLTFSTVFNLFWVPCLVMIVEDVKRRLGRYRT
ncbi:MAG: efflux RND transporter permease subunit [Deltaproteobacteria bacterium]|nr:efflux RND transporter permease subunit [Deltaproteobacteria bacterium]